MGEKNDICLNLNINKDEDGLNDFLYCWQQFGNRPNKITIHNTYTTKSFQKFIKSKIVEKNTFTEIIPDEDGMIVNDKLLVKISDKIYLSYVVIDKNQDSSVISDVVFYHSSEDNIDEIQKIIDGLNQCLLDFCEEETYNLNIATYGSNGIEIEPVLNSNIDFENFESYLSEETIKSVNKLVKKIKKSDKGLSILYGERGTGKTSTINYIAENLDRIVIFIPNNLIEQTINNPEFRKFIKKYYKPILILDDCEMIFNEYFAKSNMIVNNLLQMIDGFLFSDVSVIALFNIDDELEIDHSLLDCNNLIDVVSFDLLSEEEATDLSKIIGANRKYKNKTKLIDIIKKRNTDDVKHIGF